MNYELFEKAAAVNGQFEVIPTKTSILAKGIVIDNKGYMQYKGETYVTNMVKLSDLPFELQNLFIEKKLPAQKDTQEITEEKEVKEKKNDNFDSLNKILFEQLQNIVDPDEETDINFEFKKANAICNIADKIISIADLSLKAEIFQHKKTNPPRKSLYSE
ncbi:hypothetical protein [Arcobacter aquimarinus]|uniref:hypothetical protein n=1 Tax=Arcobacter aquimarinus TaxID=1315211 RepID=UPI003BB10CCC